MLRSCRSSALLAGALIFAAGGATQPAWAQDAAKRASESSAQPKASVKPKTKRAVAPRVPASDERPIIGSLKSLRLLDRSTKVQARDVRGNGIVLDGLPILDDPAFRERLSAFLGKPLRQSDLAVIAKTITGWYAEKDRPFADVAFPTPQDIQGGVVQVVVTEDPVVVVDLKGLRLVDAAAKVQAKNAQTAGLSIDGLPALDDPVFRAQLTPFLDKPLARSGLRDLTKIILGWYAGKGKPYAQIAFPPNQDITGGVVQGVVTEDPVVLTDLKGLTLMDNIAKLNPKGTIAGGVAIDNLPMLDDPAFKDQLGQYIGKPLTQGGLQALSKSITDWYGSKDRPYVDVAVPAGQDITYGGVQIVVTESKAGKTTFTGNKWFSDGLLASELRTKPGDPISRKTLKEDADWLSQNPFHHQDLSLKTQIDDTYRVTIKTTRSDTPGYTDFVVNTPDQFPVKVSASYDNSGAPILGRNRWTLGADWGNAAWLDQQLSYRFSSSDDVWHSRDQINGREADPSFLSHSLSYVIPLPWHDRLTIFGSYAQAVPRLGPDLGVTGVNGQASLRYSIQLPPIDDSDNPLVPILTEELQVGYDFKTSNNNLQFGGFLVSDVTTEVNQFLVVYTAQLNDRFGQTVLENNLVYSPGNITAQNKDLFYEAQVGSPFAKANYLYDHIALTRISVLPRDFSWTQDLGWVKQISWVMRVVAQTSNRVLLPSEQLGIGGADSVRGYDERQANGSRGVLVSEELRSPAFSLTDYLFHNDINDRMQLATFWDYGSVHDSQVLPGSPTSQQLESVGLGLYYSVGTNVDFRLNYGWQLRELPGIRGHSEFGHVALTVSY